MMRMAFCVLMLLSCLAVASPRSQLEASMLVEGEIDVDAQGGVERYTLSQREKLPPDVVDLIDAHIATWRFEPMHVDGRPVAIRNKMGLLLVAVPSGEGLVRIEMRNLSFYPVEEQGHELEVVSMAAPVYPRTAADRGVSGTVYLVLRIGTDGRVEDAAVEQVNLRVVASRVEMERWRGVLARSAVDKAHTWTYRRATRGEKAGSTEPVFARVPVAFSLDRREPRYGRWQAYVPGPRQPVPWLPADDGTPPDALASGGLYPIGREGGLRLRDAPGG